MKIALKYPILCFLLLTILSNILSANTGPETLPVLRSLDFKSNPVKSLRKDIRDTIKIIKSNGRAEDLPSLRFFKYKVKKDENFWIIMSRTSLNIDTLMSINHLSSARDVFPGKNIYLTNMRGIIYKVKDRDTVNIISKKYNIPIEIISRVNNLENDNILSKGYIFIPSGEVSNIDRSLFFGNGFASPLKNVRRTSLFGNRVDPIINKFRFHTGVDLACPSGTKVYASRGGKIHFTGFSGGYGLLVIIKHDNDYSTYYGHLSKILVKKGAKVKRGDLIALSGKTGRVTGPHLHFEARKDSKPINPGVLLKNL